MTNLSYEASSHVTRQETIDTLAGVFAAAARAFTVGVDGAQLTLTLGGDKPTPIPAESETRFFVRDLNHVVDFVRDATNVTEMVLIRGTRRGSFAAREVKPTSS